MPTPSQSHVVVVVVAWNGRDDTLGCLESLERTTWDALTIVLVDNGSTDGTSEAVQGRFPDVVIVRNERNLGFGEGNNTGIAAALAHGADHVLVLNNDTVVDGDLFGYLVEAARTHPDAAALCPLIYYADAPDVIWYAGADFDPRRGFGDPQTGYGERDRGQHAVARRVGRASGAAMLIPRPALERVGLFDGDLFLQLEDVEWSLRARQAGYSLWLVPAAHVWHKVSRASGGEHAALTAYYETRNRLVVCSRYLPLEGLRAASREVRIVAAQLAHARRASRPVRNARAVFAGWRDYRRRRLGVGPVPVP
jgi:GT2 family glycosyltransferase